MADRSSKKSACPLTNMKMKGPLEDECLHPELWAGPAYSKSPPPTSLPIPSFPARDRRAASLNLPSSAHVFGAFPQSRTKSAPPSPTKERFLFQNDLFFSTDSATETLRRILNIDVKEE